MSVVVAGEHREGDDRALQSLVGVLRAAEGGGIVRVGRDNKGMAEEQYWHVHQPPPRRP